MHPDDQIFGQIRALHRTSSDDEVIGVVQTIARRCPADAEVAASLAQILAGTGGSVAIDHPLIADVASTGGPSSLSTLLAPLFLREGGAIVPKLGVPGRPAGGIDCLAQIPGYHSTLTPEEVEAVLASGGYAHFLAAGEMAPLDGRMFRLRQDCGAQAVPTLNDEIADLPPPEETAVRSEDPPLDLHFGRSPRPISIKRYRAIPKEGMNRFDLQRRVPELTPPCWIRKTSGGTDLFGRLWWDRPAYTIRTEFFKPEKGRYLHPTQHRPITHREAARFQSFPDDFKFFGNKIEIAKQIGNAVPPLLAAHVAKCVAKLFEI